jgi:hypothetical protein
MKKTIQIIGLLLLSGLVISLAIRAGEHHTNCGECKLAVNNPITAK